MPYNVQPRTLDFTLHRPRSPLGYAIAAWQVAAIFFDWWHWRPRYPYSHLGVISAPPGKRVEVVQMLEGGCRSVPLDTHLDSGDSIVLIRSPCAWLWDGEAKAAAFFEQHVGVTRYDFCGLAQMAVRIPLGLRPSREVWKPDLPQPEALICSAFGEVAHMAVFGSDLIKWSTARYASPSDFADPRNGREVLTWELEHSRKALAGGHGVRHFGHRGLAFTGT